jgi:transcription termination/antitermination protein NusA
LLEVEGMDEETAYALAGQGVVTRSDLADLGTFDLLDLVEMEEARAKALVMAARNL